MDPSISLLPTTILTSSSTNKNSPQNREERSSSTRSNDKTPLLAAPQPLLLQSPIGNNNNKKDDDDDENNNNNKTTADFISNEEADELNKSSLSSRNSVVGRLQKIREYFYIDTNVQIGLEMLPPFGGKVMFYSWYLVLIVAVILQLDLNWQYQCNDVCGIQECSLGKVNKVPTVGSTSCAKIQTISTLSTSAAPFFRNNNNNNNEDNEKEQQDFALSQQDQLFLQQQQQQESNDDKKKKKNDNDSEEAEKSTPILAKVADWIISIFDGDDNHHHHSSSSSTATITSVYSVDDDYEEGEIIQHHSSSSSSSSSTLFSVSLLHHDESPSDFSSSFSNSPIITRKYCQDNNSDLPAGTNETVCGVSWFGGFGNVLDNKLNRYFHLRFTMPRPRWENETQHDVNKELNFDITFVLALKNATAISDNGFSGNRVSAYAPIRCRSNEVQCDGVTIPVVFGSVTNSSTFTLLAYDVPNLAYIAAIYDGAVQAISQKPGYTIATIVFRYVFFVVTLVNMLQLMYSRYTVWNHLRDMKEKKKKKRARQAKLRAQQRALLNKMNANHREKNMSDLNNNKKDGNDLDSSSDQQHQQEEEEDRREHLGEFEQNWALLLNFMLILYMNPFFAVSVYVDPTPRFFMFLEYKTPLYFVVTVVMCVLALCLATLETKPSYTMRISLVLLFILILVLDLVDAGKKGWHFNTVDCANFECSDIRWAIICIIILCLLVIAILLFYLHRNLAQLPYLATRPRQLSMRLMIFIFSAYVAYYVISSVASLVIFSHNDMLDQSHSELRIGTMMCAFTFVTIITTAFKFVLRTDRIPPHPSDPRWKKIVWPAQWHTWLNLHGGGAYVFFNEEEEEDFDVVQSTKQDNVSDASDGDDDNEIDAGLIRTDVNGSGSNNNNNKIVTAGYGSESQKPSAISIDDNNNKNTNYHKYSDDSNNNIDDDIDDPYSRMALHYNNPNPGSPRSNNNTNKKGHARTESTGSISQRMFRTINSMASLDDNNMSNFLKRPQQVIDKVEDFTIATAKLFRLVSANRQPFMNLESAIDCFNLAYEAYGVPVSKGDEKISTGITFSEAIHHTTKVTKKFVCCCFHAEHSDTESDSGVMSGGDSFNDKKMTKNRVGRSPSNAPEFTGNFGSAYSNSKNKYSKFNDNNNNSDHAFVTNDSIDIDPYGAAKLFSNQKERSKQMQVTKNNNQPTPSSYQPPPTSKPQTEISRASTSSNNNNANDTINSNNTNNNNNNLLTASSISIAASLSPQAPIRVSQMSNASVTSLAQATNAAFQGKVPINTEQYGYTQLFVYENFDIQVVISEMDTTCQAHQGKHPRYVIAFRGTNNQTNLRQDFRFTREVWHEMRKELSFVNSLLEAKVHKGFLEQWTALQPAVIEKMSELVLAKPHNRIYVTGHSLGGAVACLCGYTMVSRFRKMMIPFQKDELSHVVPDALDTDRLVQVYTYGMPKLGDWVFREEYIKKLPYTFRIVNESDTVSGIGVFMGHHVGTEVCIDRFGNFICNPMPVEKLFRPTQGKGVGLRHHSMYGYSTSLNKIAAHTSLGTCPVRCLDPYIPELATVAPSNNNNLSGSFVAAAAVVGDAQQQNLSSNSLNSNKNNNNNNRTGGTQPTSHTASGENSASRGSSVEPTSARSQNPQNQKFSPRQQQQQQQQQQQRENSNDSFGSDTGSVVEIEATTTATSAAEP